MRLPDGYVLELHDLINDRYVVRETSSGVLFRLSTFDVMDMSVHRMPDCFRVLANPYERMVDGWAL